MRVCPRVSALARIDARTDRRFFSLRALCLPRLDLCPLLSLAHAGSAHSRKPIRRYLRLDGNQIAALPATVFNGLTRLGYVASSPSTHAHGHMSALARTDTRTDETPTSAAALLSTCLPLWV